MNYLQKRKFCRICRYARRHAKNFILKILCVINIFSLVFWVCCINLIISWEPWIIMAVNADFLYLMAYANGWILDTKPYYERIEKEGEQK